MESMTTQLRSLRYKIMFNEFADNNEIITELEEMENSIGRHVDLPCGQDYKDQDNFITMLKDNNIIYNHGCVGIELHYPYGKKNPQFRLLTEDDGNFSRSDFDMSTYWLNDLIQVAQRTLKYLENHKKG